MKILKTFTNAGTKSWNNVLRITGVTAGRIDVSYNLIQGNQANKFGNQLVLWQNANVIPFGTPAKASQTLSSDAQTGSQSFTGNFIITNASYIVGFCAGPDLSPPAQQYGNICSSSFIPPAGDVNNDDVNVQGTIKNVNIGVTSVSFDLANFPNGVDFAGNGAWAGIWENMNAPNYFIRPKAAVQLTSTQSGQFNNFAVGRGTTYTIGIWMSGFNPTGASNQEPMACAYTFTN